MTGSNTGIAALSSMEEEGSEASMRLLMRSIIGDSEYYDFYDYLFMWYLQKQPHGTAVFARAATVAAREAGASLEELGLDSDVDVDSEDIPQVDACRVTKPYSDRLPCWKLTGSTPPSRDAIAAVPSTPSADVDDGAGGVFSLVVVNETAGVAPVPLTLVSKAPMLTRAELPLSFVELPPTATSGSYDIGKDRDRVKAACVIVTGAAPTHYNIVRTKLFAAAARCVVFAVSSDSGAAGTGTTAPAAPSPATALDGGYSFTIPAEAVEGLKAAAAANATAVAAAVGATPLASARGAGAGAASSGSSRSLAGTPMSTPLGRGAGSGAGMLGSSMPAMFVSKLKMRAAAHASGAGVGAGVGAGAGAGAAAAGDDAMATPSVRRPFDRFNWRREVEEPVHPRLIQDLKPAEELLAVRDLVTALHDCARPSDPILCTAWVESYGVSKYVETNHPYRAGETLTGTIEFPAAKKLRVWLHPMCSTPAGVKLTLDAGTVSLGPFSGVVDTSKDHKPWRGTHIDVSGSKVTYSFKVPADDVNADGLWGVGITVTAVGMDQRSKEALLVSKVASVAHCVRPLVSLWTPTMDADLCELAKRICETDRSDPPSSSSSFSPRSTLALPVDEICIRSHRVRPCDDVCTCATMCGQTVEFDRVRDVTPLSCVRVCVVMCVSGGDGAAVHLVCAGVDAATAVRAAAALQPAAEVDAALLRAVVAAVVGDGLQAAHHRPLHLLRREDETAGGGAVCHRRLWRLHTHRATVQL